MKKIVALLTVAAMLCLSQAALAAPTRENRLQDMNIEITDDLQAAIDMTVSEMAEAPVQVYVYAMGYDGEKTVVYGDVYTHDWEENQPVHELPEEAVTWLSHCQVTLRPSQVAAGGFEVESCDALSPEYRAGRTAQWQMADNTEFGYSLNLPTGFFLRDDVAGCMVWEMDAGEETLTVEAFENMGYEAALADYLDAPTGEVLLEKAEFGTFSTYGDTFYEMYVVMDGLEYGYRVRLDFPAERQGEYLFYGELIRNSFFVWGGAVG